MGRKKLNTTTRKMSYMKDEAEEVSPVFEEVGLADEPAEVNEKLDDTSPNDDINTGDALVSSPFEYEYYVSGEQPLNLGGKRFYSYDIVPPHLVTDFYLQNGHISRRLKR